MGMKTKTAVQELIDTICKVESDAIDKKVLLSVLKFSSLQKYKQQIIDAYKAGVDGTQLAEQYYNDTFKQD